MSTPTGWDALPIICDALVHTAHIWTPLLLLALSLAAAAWFATTRGPNA